MAFTKKLFKRILSKTALPNLLFNTDWESKCITVKMIPISKNRIFTFAYIVRTKKHSLKNSYKISYLHIIDLDHFIAYPSSNQKKQIIKKIKKLIYAEYK